jgi:amidase
LTECGLKGSGLSRHSAFDPFVDNDAFALAGRVQRREVSAVELVEIVIARIEALDRQLNAIATRTFERARERARKPAEGFFSGVPFLIKEMIDVGGILRTDGAQFFFTDTPQRSPALSRALEASGLNIVGVTNVPELATLPSTVNARFGVTLNAWDVTRPPAGSSGGSAMAVAAGYVPLAHATDGAGSICLPFSDCGVFGFKPSHGRTVAGERGDQHDIVKHHHGISRSVRDSAALLAVTEDRSPGARYTPTGYVWGATEGGAQRSPLRVGIDLAGLGNLTLDVDVNAAMGRTSEFLGELGHEVVPLPKIGISPTEFWERVEAVFPARMPAAIELIETKPGGSLKQAGVLSRFALRFAVRARARVPDAHARSVAYLSDCAKKISGGRAVSMPCFHLCKQPALRQSIAGPSIPTGRRKPTPSGLS